MSDTTQPAADINVLIRAHDPGKLAVLRRAVNSVATQELDGRVDILLETSGFPQILQLSDFIEGPLPAHISLQHHNIDYNFDSRTLLLRRGIRRAQAKYLYFLDFDDTLLPAGLSTLLSSARLWNNVLQIGNVELVRKTGSVTEHHPYRSFEPNLSDVLHDNCIPFNSYLVDRTLAQSVIDQVPNLSLYEDYAFLLLLLSKAPMHFLPTDICVATYNVSEEDVGKYNAHKPLADRCINRLRQRLTFPLSGQDILRLRRQRRTDDSAPLRALISGYPKVKKTSLRGYVETQEPLQEGTFVTGWCYDPQLSKKQTLVIIAETKTGHYTILSERHPRSDVCPPTDPGGATPGFSGLVPNGKLRHIWVITPQGRQILPHVPQRAKRR
ncbi:hypothetical protein NBRC116601_33610 [Cognatishimia sp. WU-CL00825]|uniref:hypothetical protein n=1 Tax=Cognatishimia sp. WU-CL00825 TaxID=3127658 RepID=UPI003107B2C1